MRNLLLIGLCLWSVVTAVGQIPVETVFEYDDNGNRIGREIYFAKNNASRKEDSMKQEFFSSVSGSFDTLNFSIFPNPTNDKLFIATKGIESCHTMRVSLVSMDGKVLETKCIVDDIETFDLSGKAPGVYLLEINVNDKKQVWKVIKQR